MFPEGTFELPLEIDLKLKIMADDVKSCTSVEVLQTHLIEVAKMSARYQHMINVILKAQVEKEMIEALESLK